MACILCFQTFNKSTDYNFVEGRGEFYAKGELNLLDFVVKPTSEYICKQCFRLLKRRKSSREKLEDINRELLLKYKTAAAKNGICVKTKSSKRALFETTDQEIEVLPSDNGSDHMADSQSQAQLKQKDLALLSPTFSPISRGFRGEIASVGESDDLDKYHQSSMESSASITSPQAPLVSTPGPSIVVKGKNSTIVYNEKQMDRSIQSFNSTTIVGQLNKSTPHTKPTISHKISRSTQTTNKIIQSTDTDPTTTTAYVRVVWKSQTREKALPSDLTSLASMLCRGTYKQIANAVWRHPTLRAHLIENFLREIDKECSNLCVNPKNEKPKDSRRAEKVAKKKAAKVGNKEIGSTPEKPTEKMKKTEISPSCLRLTKKDDILKFKLENLDHELLIRAPLMRSVLMVMSLKRSRRKGQDLFMTPAVCTAAAICLKNRSKSMTALQLIISVIIQHSGLMSSLVRLGNLRLTVSHTFLYKKMDEYGDNHLQKITSSVKEESDRLAKAKSDIPSSESTNKHVSIPENGEPNMENNRSKHIGQHESKLTVEVQAPKEIMFTNKAAEGKESTITVSSEYQSLSADIGRKLIIDNINYSSEPHEITEDHQNKVENWVGVMVTTNRISGNHLSDVTPMEDKLMQMENGLCLPNRVEHLQQRSDYIALCGNIAVKFIKCLGFLENSTVKHIKHEYSSESSQPTETTFAGMIYEDENDSSGMQEILQQLHKYVPSYGEGATQKYMRQGVVGDQLTVERGVNGLLQLENGFTPQDRLDGLHFEIADFHGGMKFLQLFFDNFYQPKATSDKCTMFVDKVLINRRNVNTDVSKKVDGCKKFFQLEVNARIVAGFMQILGIESLDEEPSVSVLPDEIKSGTAKARRKFLNELTGKVVDRFVIREGRNDKLVRRQNYQDWLRNHNPVTDDGHFLCRFNGCGKTFRHNGKRRLDHEKSHGLHHNGEVEETSKDTLNSDDMFNYQTSLLDIGLVILNFFDAVSEGDGKRVLRNWKFMLAYLKDDGARSRKYALEALYLLCQFYAILSPKDGHRLIWNRFHKNKLGLGGNIPLDLALEHYINLLKSVLRTLGSNATNPTVVDRFCKSMTVNKKLLGNFDQSCKIMKRSGTHIEANTENDLKKVVGELVKHKAFMFVSGRKYQFFRDFKPSLLEDFDVHAMYAWIEEHKRLVHLHKAGR